MTAIGSARRHASLLFERLGIAPFRQILPPTVFSEIAIRAGCAPRRRRPLHPEVVVWLVVLVALFTTSMTQGLSRAAGMLAPLGTPIRSVSEEAFCQARNRLPLRFWLALLAYLAERFEATFRDTLRWKGKFRLLMIDGSDVNLPNNHKFRKRYRMPSNQQGTARRPQAKLVAMCSVFTGFCFSFRLLSRSMTEHHALRYFTRQLREDDVVLADNGFFSLLGRA